ncbi:MAG TPA: flagellar hook-basal body complex protein FliE [Chromatiaceae bacterium]|nr:flagellar hook-basal body complex protein FliE [Chromatiaceae bacterium]
MSDLDINQILHQMRQMAAAADSKPSPAAFRGEHDGPGFEKILKESIQTVNELQQGASKVATAFEKGDPNVDLSQVMVELQKASVSFSAMVEVRNKLLSAYKDVMNMQV